MKLKQKKILLVCGTGGVGKTTLAAAIAVQAAAHGRKVALITIDPAKRLAAALGLSSLKSEPQSLHKELTQALGENPRGTLSALMLDSHATLEKFLLRVGGEEVRDVFLASELFRIIADNFGGTHDYLALEKLFELAENPAFDLIVLDTPPARHTLDFLHTPARIARFFHDAIFQWFLVDARNSSWRERLRAKGTSAALQILEKLTGDGVINDFIRLAPHIQKVKKIFVERQEHALSLLRSKQAGALFITAPHELRRGEAEPFLTETKNQGITVLGAFVNRSLQHLAAKSQPEAPEAVLAIYQNLCILMEEEQRNVSTLQKIFGASPIHLVPEQAEDIHTLAALATLARSLPIEF